MKQSGTGYVGWLTKDATHDGDAIRARSWYREFREIVLMCDVYNIKCAVS